MKLRQIANLGSIALISFGLSGCGGTNPAKELANNINITVGAQTTVSGGEATLINAITTSSPSTIASMSWGYQKIGTGPDLTMTNADCAQKSVTSSGSTISPTSSWGCSVGILAPTNILGPTDYKLIVTSKDIKGNTSFSSTNLTVKPNSQPAPTVVLVGEISVRSGDINRLACNAEGGTTTTVGQYSYQWVVINDGGLKNANLVYQFNNSTNIMKAPIVSTRTIIELACRATDEALKTGSGNIVVTIDPAIAAKIVPSVLDALAVDAGESLKVDATKTSWVDSTGVIVLDKAIYFNWKQKSGTTSQILNVATSTPTIIFPSASTTTATAQETIVFTLSVSDQPFVNGISPGVVSFYDAVFFVNYSNPISITISQNASVKGGTSGTAAITAVGKSGASLYYGWTQISGPAVTIGGANTPNIAFIAPANAGPSSIAMLFRVAVGYAPITVTNPGTATSDVLVAVTP